MIECLFGDYKVRGSIYNSGQFCHLITVKNADHKRVLDESVDNTDVVCLVKLTF